MGEPAWAVCKVTDRLPENCRDCAHHVVTNGRHTCAVLRRLRADCPVLKRRKAHETGSDLNGRPLPELTETGLYYLERVETANSQRARKKQKARKRDE